MTWASCVVSELLAALLAVVACSAKDGDACDSGNARECVGTGACDGAQVCRDGTWSRCDCEATEEGLEAEAVSESNRLAKLCEDLYCDRLASCLDTQTDLDNVDECLAFCDRAFLEAPVQCLSKMEAFFVCLLDEVPANFCDIAGPDDRVVSYASACAAAFEVADACFSEAKADLPCCCCEDHGAVTTIGQCPDSFGGGTCITTTTGDNYSCTASTHGECETRREANSSVIGCENDEEFGIVGGAFLPREECLAELRTSLASCIPLGQYCEGLDVVFCTFDGKPEVVEHCPESCALGACQPCEGGTERCVDGALQQCRIDYGGGGWEVTGACQP